MKPTAPVRPLILWHARGPGFDNDRFQHHLMREGDLAELDVRRSRDGQLFCFHGSVPLGMILGWSFRFMRFERVRRLLPNILTLSQAVHNAPKHVRFYLDLKDSHITYDELQFACGEQLQHAWLASYSHQQLMNLQAVRKTHTLVLNRPVSSIRELENIASLVDVIQLFWWFRAEKFKEKAIALGLDWYIVLWPGPEATRAERSRRGDSLMFCDHNPTTIAAVRPTKNTR